MGRHSGRDNTLVDDEYFQAHRSIVRLLVPSATLFTLLFSFGGSEMVMVVFRTTMMFALPVWLLYLPFVVFCKDAEQWRILILLVSGVAIGPASLVVLRCFSQLRGGNVHQVWIGDGEGFIPCMVFAAIVGVWTTGLYVTALKVIHLRGTVVVRH